jgi:hypothetical protein
VENEVKRSNELTVEKLEPGVVFESYGRRLRITDVHYHGRGDLSKSVLGPGTDIVVIAEPV